MLSLADSRCWGRHVHLWNEEEGIPMASSPRPYQALFEQEEELSMRPEELVRSHAELQAFAYTAAHELKEPLRTIRVFTQLLVGRVELDEADREVVQFIVDGVQRLSTLVDDMLSSAVQGFVESLDSVELGPVATQAIGNLRESHHFERGHYLCGPTARGGGTRIRLDPAFSEPHQQRDQVSKRRCSGDHHHVRMCRT
jgi:signal transduction histidine kinase